MGAAAERVSDDSTRRRVVQAAVECILERGFYRASSNEIARRAGMTWGAIQYYFGTREMLMLEALHFADERMERMFEAAVIDGTTAEERLVQLTYLFAEQYGRPEYLASIQIVLNLAHNPSTSQETAEALVDYDTRLSTQVSDLISRAVGRRTDAALTSLIFHSCRGIVLSRLVTTETTPRQLERRFRPDSLDTDIRRLARGLALLLDEQPTPKSAKPLTPGKSSKKKQAPDGKAPGGR